MYNKNKSNISVNKTGCVNHYDISIIIPTYNEEENIVKIINAVDNVLKESQINGQIIIVDDHSSDRTIDMVSIIEKNKNNVKIFVRYKDPGLSQSVLYGFNQADSNIYLVMDADFSHPPELIPVFYQEIQNGADIVIGSRYAKGGAIEDWPIKRKLISFGATMLARIIVPQIKDPVSGFFAIRREVLEYANLKPRGYKILFEILGKGHWRKVKEVPFTFKDRRYGTSKLKGDTIVNFTIQFVDILFYKILPRKKLFTSKNTPTHIEKNR